jgi:hypothetical protein
MDRKKMMFELCNCTNVLLNEISHKEIKQKDVAITYRFALKSSDQTDWESVNQAIIKRWSMAGLKRIKDMAWKLK